MAKKADKEAACIQTVTVLNAWFYIVRIGDKRFVRKSPKAAREILEGGQNESSSEANT